MVKAGVMRLVETVAGEPVPWPAPACRPGNGEVCVFERAAKERRKKEEQPERTLEEQR
jgi:hypothetical protein